ncbi:MAG: response regulator [Deltaproteobacteria bacterium]|nr:response regulator [Deltaproteobacteria bacterium]
MSRRKRHAKTIVVVDDDRETRRTLESLFERQGLRVMSAANGLQLVRMLKVHHPDLIIMETSVSWLDCMALCKLLRARKEWSKTRIAFMTATPTETVRDRVYESGSEHLFAKPIDPETVMAAVRRILQLPQA